MLQVDVDSELFHLFGLDIRWLPHLAGVGVHSLVVEGDGHCGLGSAEKRRGKTRKARQERVSGSESGAKGRGAPCGGVEWRRQMRGVRCEVR